MRSMKMAALAVAITLMCSGLALARDKDHDHDKDKHDHWFKHDDHDRHHDHDRDCENTITGKIAITTGDRERLEREHHWWERERRRDDGYYRGGQIYNGYPGGTTILVAVFMATPAVARLSQRGLWVSRFRVRYEAATGGNGAYGFGYQDGSYMARRDIAQNKRFNPNPRNEYGNRTHGYNSAFGDKNYYKAEYSNGYSAGYEANYRGGRGW